jgi:WD40 repeat protein
MLSYRLLPISILSTVTLIVYSSIALSLTPPEIINIAKKSVVRIDGAKSGTGFVIKKNGKIYTILTNAHVLNGSGSYKIVAPDGQSYPLLPGRVFPLNVDLAEAEFTSDRDYQISNLGDSQTLEVGNNVYTYGWSGIYTATNNSRTPQFLQGYISSIKSDNTYKGYDLNYTLSRVPGLSGSPLFNDRGEVIGIYGLEDDRSTLTLGISIATYQRYASTARGIPVSPAPTPTVSNPPPILQPDKAANDNFSLAYSLSDHQVGVKPVAISPDGQTLVSGSWDKTIKVWGLRDGKLLRTLSDHQGGVGSVAISSDGQTLVSGSGDKTIKVWGLRDGKLLRTLSGHQGNVESVAISPDGQTLVSGSGDKTIKVWGLRDGKLLRTLSGHQGDVESVAISSDGQTLVSGSFDKTIKVWRLRDGKLLRTLSGHQDWVKSVAISPDGQTLVSGSEDKTIKVWGLRDGKLLRTLSGHQGDVISVAISPDGQTLASGSMDKTINVWRSSP